MTTSEEIDARVAGRTVAKEFLDTIDRHSERTALRWLVGDEWKSLTYAEVRPRRCRRWASARATESC
jgi:hypothetical protein